MAITKRLCTFLLVFALLVPAISFHDDAIWLSAVLAGEGAGEDALAAVGHFPDSDYDPLLAILLEGLENIHVDSDCSLHIDVSSAPLDLIEFVGSCNRSVASPVGRAPPVA